tara:strand:+ start:134 stop:1177 length:1044 start_codon:yes stop_codon:yes gene_type:complete
MKYLRFTLMPGLILLFIIVVYYKNEYLFPLIVFVNVLIICGDYFLPRDNKIRKYPFKGLFDLILFIHLPIMIILLVIISIRSIHIINPYEIIGIIFLTGLFLGSGSTVVAHELVHRTKNKFSLWVGNWLLALSWDNAFSIEHVYGHHKNIGYDIDPATAKRGQSIYSFLLSSTFNQMRNAYNIELSRVSRQNLWWVQNRFILGLFRNLFILMAIFFIGGGNAVFIYCPSIIWAKILLETVNYIEHYGLVRVEGRPVRPRHSWNSNHMISGTLLYYLTRHSAHHEKASLKFYDLEPYSDAPALRYGYLSMIYLALGTPSIYRLIMDKQLKEWDCNYASKNEQLIISKA